MNKTYIAPELDIIKFDINDIISNSNGTEGGTGDNDWDDDWDFFNDLFIDQV